jgi:hypothetical protein
LSDGLVEPLNVPPGASTPVGVQAGVTQSVVLANQVIVFGTAGGLFIYNGTPGLGNPPIFYATSATVDPFGNVITPTAGLTGTGQFMAGFTVINTAGIFVYSAAPTVGDLIAAIASAAGSDAFANPYPQGLYGQVLTLNNQSAGPPAFANGSVFYSSTNGRPRYLSQAGVDNVLDRGTVNVSQFTQGNSVTPAIIGGPCNYEANEGTASSEYQLEIDGIITTSTVTPNTLIWGLAVDGTILGAQFTVGASFLVINHTFEYTIRFRLTIIGQGSGGNCALTADGQITEQGQNQGNAGVSTPVGAQSMPTNKAFDSTSNHTIQPYVSWGGAAASQTLTTYRTGLTRKN